MMAKKIVFFLAGLLIALPAFAQERRRPDTSGPSALESHAARLEQNATEDLQAGKLASGWFVDLDMVFPADRQEYEAVGKNALMVFTLFSDDQGRLPLARAYVGDKPVQCLPPVPRDVPPKSATAKSFGTFRADTLCLLPIELKRKSNRIAIDFTKDPKGLEVSSVVVKEPDFIKADPDPHSASPPDPVALQAFVDREYPGFGFQVRP